MKQSEARSAWYHDNFKARRKKDRDGKKRRVWITVIIVLCVPAVFALSAIALTLGMRFVVFSDQNGREYAITIPGADSNNGDSSGSTAPSVTPVDPEEFFQQYYTSEEKYPDSEMERIYPVGNWTVTLNSAADHDALTLQELYQKNINSIVSIEAYTDTLSAYAWGTGVVLSEDGCIVTNQHIISGKYSASVILQDGTEYKALLVGEDKQTDIAVLKIDATGLIPAEFGDSNELAVGDSVAAIGNPISAELSGTMTNGIISAINRDITLNGRRMTLIQTDTAINNGSSGGALINQYGQVVGITNMKMSSYYTSATIEGLGFAIPSTTVKTIADQLIAEGKVSGRPGLGVTVGSIPDTAAKQYGYPKGLYVSEIADGSDAKEQGLQVGDIITAVNGESVVTTQDVIDIRDRFSVGDTLIFSVWRDGEAFDLPIKIVDMNDLS